MPEGARTARSARCPYMSAMIPWSRRATAAESSSASTTTRPATRCSPPAKRSIAAASALRAEGRVTSRWLSSSLASPVSAMHVLLGAGGRSPRGAVAGTRVPCVLVLDVRLPGRAVLSVTGHARGVLRLDISVHVVEQVTVRGGEAHRVVLRCPVAHAHLAQQGADAAALCGLRELEGVAEGGGVGQQRVEAAALGALKQHVEHVQAGHALRLLRADGEVRGDAAPCGAGADRLRDLRDHQVG